MQEGFPSLVGALAPRAILTDGGIEDRDAELGQFSLDPLATTGWIARPPVVNERQKFAVEGGSAAPGARFPAPEKTEAQPMPGNHILGPNKNQGPLPIWPEPLDDKSKHPTRLVEWSGGANMIRPMTSSVSALSGIVANGHQAIHFVSSAPSFHAARRVFPSTAEGQPYHPAPFRNLSGLRLTQDLRFIRFWPFRIQASGTAAAPTGPWLSAVSHAHACKRYYSPMRQPDELRPAWLSQLTLAGLCPSRAVRLAFPSLLCHTVPTCRYRYPGG